MKTVKLKCIDNKGNNFLTVGKIYESDTINTTVEVCINDDWGCGIRAITLDNPFGKFEVVSEG